MWRLGRTETFDRTARRFLRRRPALRTVLAGVLADLERDPFAPHLRTHSLSGGLAGLHAVRVSRQVRLIVRLDAGEAQIVLLDIGMHDDVYR